MKIYLTRRIYWNYNCGRIWLKPQNTTISCGFSSLLDIDKITLTSLRPTLLSVLVLCWILIKLHSRRIRPSQRQVLVLCWILIKLHGREFVKHYGVVLVLCWILIKLHGGQLERCSSRVLVLCWILIKLHEIYAIL